MRHPAVSPTTRPPDRTTPASNRVANTPGSHPRNRDGDSPASDDRLAPQGSADSGASCALDFSGTPGMVLRHREFLCTSGAHRPRFTRPRGPTQCHDKIPALTSMPRRERGPLCSSTPELEAELVGLAGHLTAAQCRFLLLLAEFDAPECVGGPRVALVRSLAVLAGRDGSAHGTSSRT